MISAWERYGNESRTLRDRQADRDALDDRDERKPPAMTARMLVQVVDQGAMPTAPLHYWATNPVGLDGPECEGCTGTPTPDASTTYMVDFIRGTPAVGDYAVAYGVGGRWVAEKSGHISECTNCGVCGSCVISTQDLALSWENTISGGGSATLSYNGSTWSSGCTDDLLFAVDCSGGQVEFWAYSFSPGACPSGQSQYASTLGLAPNRIVLDSLQCADQDDPFDLEAHVTQESCPGLAGLGFTSFSITGTTATAPAPPVVCATFRVFGCFAIPYPDVTVNVYASEGGKFLASGKTNIDGQVTLSWTKTPNNSVWVNVTGISDRLLSLGQTITGTFCNPTITLGLNVAPGYVCRPCCLLPLSASLNMTDSIVGSAAITYQTRTIGGVDIEGWWGDTTYTFPGCVASVPPGTPPYCEPSSGAEIGPLALQFYFSGSQGTIYCGRFPNGCPYSYIFFPGGVYTAPVQPMARSEIICPDCPPAFDWTGTGIDGCFDFSGLSCLYCGMTSIMTVTE